MDICVVGIQKASHPGGVSTVDSIVVFAVAGCHYHGSEPTTLGQNDTESSIKNVNMMQELNVEGIKQSM